VLVTAGDAVELIPDNVAGVTDTHDGVGDCELEDVCDGEVEPASNTHIHTHASEEPRMRVVERERSTFMQLHTAQCIPGLQRMQPWVR
jgi:hypothetical protein